MGVGMEGEMGGEREGVGRETMEKKKEERM